jgi:hypothetical protein
VLGDLGFWRQGLGGEGVDIREDAPADLVVAPAHLAASALELGPRMLVCHGDATRALKSAGYECRTYLPIPSADSPRAWVPLDDPAVCGYVLNGWTAPSTRSKGVRNELLRWLIARGRPPARGSWLVVGARERPVPLLVKAAAAELGAGRPSWFLTVGAGDSLDYRGVLHLFREGARVPDWVVKFARRPGLDETFERDRSGLALAAGAGPVVTERAPQLVATFESSGLPASIETAAPGAALSAVLRSRRSRRSKLEIVERVASWIVEVGVASAQRGGASTELERLATYVVPQWRAFGLEHELVPAIGDVPGVLLHNDLWSENVIVGGGSFKVVDWEDARAGGLPLWDLVYFLADALALADGAFDVDARHDHFVSLFRGKGGSSPILFDHVRRAAGACSVPADAVGPIVTACWLSQVLAHATRGEDAARFEVHGLAELPPGEQWATLWLSDPELGPGWSSWRP